MEIWCECAKLAGYNYMVEQGSLPQLLISPMLKCLCDGGSSELIPILAYLLAKATLSPINVQPLLNDIHTLTEMILQRVEGDSYFTYTAKHVAVYSYNIYLIIGSL